MKKSNSIQIDFKQSQQIVYWSKKWEISPMQLFKAFKDTRVTSVTTIEKYLRKNVFAL